MLSIRVSIRCFYMIAFIRSSPCVFIRFPGARSQLPESHRILQDIQPALGFLTAELPQIITKLARRWFQDRCFNFSQDLTESRATSPSRGVLPCCRVGSPKGWTGPMVSRIRISGGLILLGRGILSRGVLDRLRGAMTLYLKRDFPYSCTKDL